MGVRRATSQGQAISGLTSAFIKRTGFGLCGERTRSSGDTAADLAALLKPKSAVNNVLVVNMGPHDTMMTSFLGDVYDLNYAVDKRGPLRNEITAVVTHPASVRNAQETPYSSTTILTRRNYTDDERVSYFQLPASAVEKVLKLQQDLTAPRADYGEGTNHSEIDAQRKKHALEMIRMIEALYAPSIYQGECSLRLGITDAALTGVRGRAVPMSLCSVVNQQSTAIAERACAVTDMRPWLRDQVLRDSLIKAFITEHYSNSFGILKNPNFLGHFIDTSERYLKNMVTNNKHSKNAMVVGDDGIIYPVLGYLFMSGHMASQTGNAFGTTQSGTYKSLRPINLIPDGAFNKHMIRGEGESWIMINESKDDEETFGVDGDIGNIPLVKLLKSKDPDAVNNITEITDLGKDILGENGGTALDDHLAKIQEKQRLKIVPVEKACRYVIHNNAAVIIDIVEEALPRSFVSLSNSEKTATMVNKMAEMMRVSVGDIPADQSPMLSWASDIISKNSRSNFPSGRNAFMQKPVTMYTPEITGAKHVFDVGELETGFLQPYLFDVRDQVAQLNKQLVAANSLTKSLAPIRQIYLRRVGIANLKKLKFEAYVESKGSGAVVKGIVTSELEAELLKNELHPFFEFKAVVTGTNAIFEAVPRKVYAEIPDYVLKKCVNLLRGNQLLAHATSQESLIALNEGLVTAMKLVNKDPTGNLLKDNNISAAFENLGQIADQLVEMLHNLFPHVAKLETIAKAHDKLSVVKLILAPLVTGLRSRLTDKDITIGKERVAWAAMYPDQKLPPVACANLYEVALSSDMVPILRATTMMMMLLKISPVAMKAILQSRVHPGFAIDFMRRSVIYSNELVYAKPKSLDMILCSGPVKVERDGNENLKGEISARIRTTSNMFTGAAVVATCAYPNSRGANLATLSNGRPRIAIDSITRSKHGLLSRWGAEGGEGLTADDKNIIKTTLAEAEQMRLELNYKGEIANAEEAYVGILRPVDDPTEKAKPFTGLPRYLASPLPNSNNTYFQQFHEAEGKSCNVYMNNLGAVYYQMYTPNNSRVETNDGCFRIDTTCYTNSKIPVSEATLALEDAMSFSPESLSILNDNENDCLGSYVTPDMYRGRGRLEINHFSGMQRRDGLLSAANLNITGRSGYCSPLTHFTDESFAKRADEKRYSPSGSAHIGDGPSTHAIFSPFHIAPSIGVRLAGKNQFPSIY